MTNGALTDDDSPNPNDLSDVTQQAVNDAIEQLGTTDPDAIKEWLVEHGYVTNNIPAGADWSPGVNNDDIKTPVTNIGRFDAWTGVKGPVSVVTEWPESQTFQSAFEALQDANDPVDGGAFRDWVTIAQQLESHTQEFRSRFSAVDGWDGKSADALKANVAAFTDPA